MKNNLPEQINQEYAKFENKVKPLREKLAKLQETNNIKVLSKHKGIIYFKKHGKDCFSLKILKSMDKDRFKFIRIYVETDNSYHINYIRERNKLSKKETIRKIQEILNE